VCFLGLGHGWLWQGTEERWRLRIGGAEGRLKVGSLHEWWESHRKTAHSRGEQKTPKSTMPKASLDIVTFWPLRFAVFTGPWSFCGIGAMCCVVYLCSQKKQLRAGVGLQHSGWLLRSWKGMEWVFGPGYHSSQISLIFETDLTVSSGWPGNLLCKPGWPPSPDLPTSTSTSVVLGL
jgi:hypothetical protein